MQLPEQAPNIIEAGHVLATLDDWRAVLFMFGFIIVFLLFFTIWREWAMQSERKLMASERQEMRDLAADFATSASKVANSLGELSTKIAVLSALTARAESFISEQGTLREKDHGTHG